MGSYVHAYFQNKSFLSLEYASGTTFFSIFEASLVCQNRNQTNFNQKGLKT